MDSTRRQLLQALGVTIANAPLVPALDAQTSCTTEIASETAGSYPSLQTFVRQDIREGRTGLPLTLVLSVISSTTNCTDQDLADGLPGIRQPAVRG